MEAQSNNRPMTFSECSCEEKRKCVQRGVEFELIGEKDGKIYLDFNFAPYRPELPVGTVSITFKRCMIIFDIENGQIPLNDLGQKQKFNITIPIEISKKTGAKNAKSSGLKMGLKVGLEGLHSNFGAKQTEASDEMSSNDESYTTEEYQISAGGTNINRIWFLEDKKSGSGLRGAPDNKLLLGGLKKNGDNCRIWAKLVADKRDILMESVRIFPNGISRNNSLIRKLLIYRYCYKDAPEKKYRSPQDVHLWFLNCKCFQVEDEQPI